jgi:hypothetical protein
MVSMRAYIEYIQGQNILTLLLYIGRFSRSYRPTDGSKKIELNISLNIIYLSTSTRHITTRAPMISQGAPMTS